MGRKTRTPHFVDPTCLSVCRPFHCNDPIELKPRKHHKATDLHTKCTLNAHVHRETSWNI